MSTRIRSCYISSAPGAKLDVLRDVLAKKGIRVAVPEELVLGTDWLTELSSILAQVDLVIGIVTRERRSEWILFELGVAWAKRLQILLLAPRKSYLVPPDLQRFLVVRAQASAIGKQLALR